MSERVVLAYSGGLDTSVAVPWLRETYGYDVVALTADVGGGADLRAIQQRALSAGASLAVGVDARRPFVEEYVWPALMAGSLYQGIYPLATALARPLIARLLVEAAHETGAWLVAHGCTGKGNDQVRFDVAIAALDPGLTVIAPMRAGMGMNRDEELAYALARGIALEAGSVTGSPYSVDVNLWGRSVEAGVLEDPWLAPPADAFAWTVDPASAPSAPVEVEVEFEAGVPVRLDGAGLDGVALVERLNVVGGRYGIGRIDHVEDRLVGIKSRELYEAPAATLLHQAHAALEQLVLSRDLLAFKRQVADRLATLVYDGLWFSELGVALRGFAASTQARVSGTVRLRLAGGSAAVVGRRSPHSLYRHDLATYGAADGFDHAAAVGFIRLWGLPVRTQAAVHGAAAGPDGLLGRLGAVRLTGEDGPPAESSLAVSPNPGTASSDATGPAEPGRGQPQDPAMTARPAVPPRSATADAEAAAPARLAGSARRARAEDVGAIFRIVDHYTRLGILLPRSHEEIAGDINSFRVAVHGDTVAGVAALRDYGAGVGELRSLSVLPHAQGHGLGAQLVEAVMEKAREHGVAELYVVTASPGYFARFGWTELPMSEVPDVLDVDRAQERPRHLWNTAMVLRLQEAAAPIDAPALEARVHVQVYPRQPLTIVSGAGCWVTDQVGRRYLDLVAGIAVDILGHASPVIADAISRQARRLVHVSNLYYTIPQLELAEALVRRSPFDRAFFVNSGAEANETAIKLARRRGQARGAFEIVAVEGSFHGRTMGALAATGQAKYRDPFEPLPGGFWHVPLDDEAALRAAVGERTCAVLIEPIQGESGVRPASEAFLAAAREACDAVDALLIFDEVQSGMGRTGTFFAFEQTSTIPDAATLAKGLGGGLPIGALLATDRAAVFERGDHGTTLGGNPLACAAALATLDTLDGDHLLENARMRGAQLAAGLARFVAAGLATEVRGRGLMLALETAGPWTREAVAAARDRHGLLVNATGETTLRFVPPLTISAAEVDEALARLGPALLEASGQTA